MLATGDVFAGYAIERRLGQGGMGSVYLARHPRLPRQTALKLLNPELFADTEIRARFEREADLAAQLEHPNIVTVYDRGVDDGRLWISMQFVDGVDAATIEHPVPAERALHIVEGTAAALDHAHRNGVLHRDVKPANILLADSDGRERVLLTDFGIARPRDDVHHLTQTGTFTATLAYASPEQLTGAHLDHRSDQYSLACTLYSLLTGVAPYEATNPVLVIQGHLQSPPPSVRGHRPELPAALDAVLARALAKRASDRFDSCAEFAAAARRALSGTGAQPTVFAGSSMPQFAQPSPYGPALPAPQHAAPQPYPGLARPPSGNPAPPYHGYAPRPGAAGPRPYPQGQAPPPRRRTGRLVALAIVCALLLGGGVWAWQDDTGFVAQQLERSRGHRDLTAMSEAFPGMLPASSDKNDGYGGTTCKGAPVWKSFYAIDKGAERSFNGWQARWECLGPGDDTFAYRFYSFGTVDAARSAVSAFTAASTDRGTVTVGTRQEHRLICTDRYDGEKATIISTFTSPDHARFVLLAMPAARGNKGDNQRWLDDLVTRMAKAPL
ncbi:protein kinase [Nocardia sp. NPDC060259]|uniref:serine/threonine-protein kinase n=1 Tax=Nocardia sp. NPDC060259 TaxID=3347088 RepID=UPI00364CE1E1